MMACCKALFIPRRFYQSLAMAVVLTSLNALAAASLGSDDIKATVNQFMQTHISRLSDSYGDNVRIDYQLKNLDPRLSLAACPAPLVTELQSTSNIGRITLKVSCDQQQHWSIYVPVEVDLFRPVVIAVMPVARGDQLSAGQLELREINISQLNGRYFTDPAEIIGMQAKRPLRADQPIIAYSLEPPLMIKKGDAVLMTAQARGLVVKIPGTALSDGHQGQQISVRNRQSKRIVEARVTAPGQVTVAM